MTICICQRIIGDRFTSVRRFVICRESMVPVPMTLSLKTYRDLKNSLDTAEEKGRVEGRGEEKIAIARNLKARGMSISDVSKATGLQEEEIKAL